MSWSVELYQGSGTWLTQTAFANPNSTEFSTEITSTAQLQTLFDGSLAITQPEVTYNYEPITLTWAVEKNTTLRNRIYNYIKSGSGIRLTTHTGEQFTGIFMKAPVLWRKSPSSRQKYNLTVEFQQLNEDMLRNQTW